MNDSLTLAALEMGKTPVVVLLLYMATVSYTHLTLPTICSV